MIDIKIGRNVYTITDKDLFLDNGACVQLITQKGVWENYRHKPIVLPKKVLRQLECLNKIYVEHSHGSSCTVYKLEGISQ